MRRGPIADWLAVKIKLSGRDSSLGGLLLPCFWGLIYIWVWQSHGALERFGNWVRMNKDEEYHPYS